MKQGLWNKSWNIQFASDNSKSLVAKHVITVQYLIKSVDGSLDCWDTNCYYLVQSLAENQTLDQVIHVQNSNAWMPNPWLTDAFNKSFNQNANLLDWAI